MAAAAAQARVEAGGRLGASWQFGTQGNRMGLTWTVFARSDDLDTELAFAASALRTFSHMETRRPGFQRQLLLGLTQGFGRHRSRAHRRDWSVAANNLDRRHSFSLYSVVYRDSYATSQRVRGLALSIGDVSVRFENDFDLLGLLGDGRDRFRTSAVEIAWRATRRRRHVLGFNLFTGDPEQGRVVRPAPDRPTRGRHGDYDMRRRDDGTPVTAADRSIGNAWVGVRGVNLAGGRAALDALGLSDLQMRIGWSGEGVRDVLQNRFHDLIFNPHVPLREDARARPYFALGTNHGQTLYP